MSVQRERRAEEHGGHVRKVQRAFPKKIRRSEDQKIGCHLHGKEGKKDRHYWYSYLDDWIELDWIGLDWIGLNWTSTRRGFQTYRI